MVIYFESVSWDLYKLVESHENVQIFRSLELMTPPVWGENARDKHILEELSESTGGRAVTFRATKQRWGAIEHNMGIIPIPNITRACLQSELQLRLFNSGAHSD